VGGGENQQSESDTDTGMGQQARLSNRFFTREDRARDPITAFTRAPGAPEEAAR